MSSFSVVISTTTSITGDIHQTLPKNNRLSNDTHSHIRDASQISHDLTDDELIEQILLGQQHAYEQLFQRHIRRVISIAWHFFRSKETVEDITQETFTKAYFSLSSYRHGASFGHWLAKIAINNCYDELRRRKKCGEILVTDLTDNETNWIESKLAVNSLTDFFSLNDKQNASEIIYKLLARLHDEDKLVLTLLHVHDYSVKEISQMLNWSEAKVKIRAFRARHNLRKALKQLTVIARNKQSSSQIN